MVTQDKLLDTAEDFLVNVPKLLEQLKEDTIPLWGVMDPQNMIEHLIGALYMSLNNKSFQGTEKEARNRKALLNYEFRPTISSKAIKPGYIYDDFFKAKDLLLKTLDKFSKNKPNSYEPKTAHFYFGWLTYDEWIVFHYRHFSHHFKQFQLANDE